jgi:hypothetical protein
MGEAGGLKGGLGSNTASLSTIPDLVAFHVRHQSQRGENDFSDTSTNRAEAMDVYGHPSVIKAANRRLDV